MNIEIANRLVNLRKQNQLSQEALAEKLGISRQAVSKWERAEASPDTDNLILLARLYGVSLDDLLKTEEEIAKADEYEEEVNEEEASDTVYNAYEEYDSQDGDYVHVGFDGIHVRDEKNVVHVGWKGIHVRDKNEDEVKVDRKGVFINGEEIDVKEHIHKHSKNFRKKVLYTFPVDLLVVAVYIYLGIFTGIWHPSWLIFFAIPLWHSIVEMILLRDANYFAYPVIMVAIYLYIGFVRNEWHPGWVIFLTIPIYYGFVSWIKAIFTKSKKGNNE